MNSKVLARFLSLLLPVAAAPLAMAQFAPDLGRSGPMPPLNAAPAGGLRVGTFPGISEAQLFYYQQALNLDYQMTDLAVTNARSALVAASVTVPRDDRAIASRVEALAAADAASAKARADSFQRVQAGPNRLTREQVSALVANGGRYSAGNGIGGNNSSIVAAMDFNDHEGYVSLFDGVSLKGWDGDPRYWRVENGAIVGESSAQNPSGNSYISYRDLEAHDFTLKMEVKTEGTAGTGIQYRSKTGIPWLANINNAVANNNGAVRPEWMTTGPQADFWPTTVHTGQFYSENTPMRILARRGTVVEGFGYVSNRIMGSVGDPAALQGLVKMNDWNQYTVIARGPVFIHIINGAVMSVYIDDDPKSSNNWSGQIGMELEATGRVSFRNIWLKKLN